MSKRTGKLLSELACEVGLTCVLALFTNHYCSAGTIGSLMLEHYCQPAVVSSDISRPNAEGESKQPEHWFESGFSQDP